MYRTYYSSHFIPYCVHQNNSSLFEHSNSPPIHEAKRNFESVLVTYYYLVPQHNHADTLHGHDDPLTPAASRDNRFSFPAALQNNKISEGWP